MKPEIVVKPEHPSLLASLRALPPAAWILFSGMFLNKFGGFVVPFLALYRNRPAEPCGVCGASGSCTGRSNLRNA
jgi:hypothetical protein